MKFEKSVMVTNAIFFGAGIIIIAMAGADAISIGLVMLLIAFVDFVLAFIYLVQRKKNAMLNALILSGVLFTIGFSICSNSHMDFR